MSTNKKILKSLHEAALEGQQYHSDIKTGKIVPSSTGRRYLDDSLLGGTNDSDIILLGGLTGTGKSTEMVEIAYNLATLNKNVRVCFFSFEMPGRKLASKMISKKLQTSLRDMYNKDIPMINEEEYNAFKDIPIDIVEMPFNIYKLESICNQYCLKYPNDRCHFIFDHSMLITNAKGNNSMETLELLSIMCNDTKKIGSRVYFIVSQMNDKIQDYKRLATPGGQLPRMEDVYGSKTVSHACNTMVLLARPAEMHLPSNTYGPNKLPIRGATSYRTKLGKMDFIYAVTIKARDGSIGVEPLLCNLKNSELIQLEDNQRTVFRTKHKI